MRWPREHRTQIDYYGLALDVVGEPRQASISSSIDNFEFEAAHDHLQDGDRALVAGCGMGSVATWMASRLGVEAVVAYEPNARLHQMVSDHVRVGGEPLHVEYAALAAGSGRQPFYIPSNWTRGSLHRPTAVDEGPVEQFCVRTVGINEAIARHRANVLLLDVEGAEYEILPVLDFRPLRLIVTEIHGQGKEVAELKSLIGQHGFTEAVHYDGFPAPWLHIVAAVRDEQAA